MSSGEMQEKGRLEVNPPQRPPMRLGTRQTLPERPTVLLLVDLINPFDFASARRLEPAALVAARAVARLKARLTEAGAMTIYANDNYGQWRSDFRDVLASCRQRGGVSAEIADLIEPSPEDLVILKPRHSAFFGTPLDLVLTQVHAQRLVIAGLSTDICVQLSAMDANLRCYKLWVPADCTAAESGALKRDALDYLARVMKADVGTAARRRRLI